MFGKAKGNKNNNAQDNQVNQDNLTSAPINTPEAIEDDGFSDFFDGGEQAQESQQVTATVTEQAEIAYQHEENDQVHIEDDAYYDSQFDVPEQTQPYQSEESTDQSSDSNKDVDMVLYIIADKKENGLTAYFRDCNIKVSSVFDDIIEAKNAVLMQSMPTRIVIVDSGRGKFTMTKVRDEIIDMLGISDEQNKTTVFYTDSALKVDTLRALGKAGKEIDWIQYKSTPIVAATILAYKENYVYDMEDDIESKDDEKSILSMKGLRYTGENSPRMEISGFSKKSILENIVNKQGNELQGFEINL